MTVPVNIMPLGDSITAGSHGADPNGTGGYRAVLWQRLHEAGFEVDFVGSITDELVPVGSGHEGHHGWRTDELALHIEHWLQVYQPHLIALQIGINDIVQEASTRLVVSRLTDLVDKILQRSNAHLIVAAIVGVLESNDYHVDPQKILAYNAAIPGIVQEQSMQGCKISFLDMFTLANLREEHFAPDGLHLNDHGYHRVAEAWYGEVASHLKSIGNVSKKAAREC